MLKHMKEFLPSVPVIIVTGFPEGILINEAANLGYVSILSKPLTSVTVKEVLQKHNIKY